MKGTETVYENKFITSAPTFPTLDKTTCKSLLESYQSD